MIGGARRGALRAGRGIETRCGRTDPRRGGQQMLMTRSILVGIVLALIGSAAGAAGIRTAADADGPAQIAFPAPSKPGRVVIVISGKTGLDRYEDYAEKVSKLGYYAVLLDGSDILSPDKQGGDRLRKAITRAQSSANAVPGKVAVIGFSLGGGAALTYAARMPSTVATIVVYYPETAFIGRVSDVKSFVGNFKVPVLAFAGGKDTYSNCCLIGTIRSMDAAAKELGAAMELVVYPQAKHDFIMPPDYRAADAADAWMRTVEALRRSLAE
jgi:dienelactone hydrolase